MSQITRDCLKCGSDFIVDPLIITSLITAASHCPTCTSEYSAKFSAIFCKEVA